MILVFDSGNSQIKTGVFKEDKLLLIFRMANDKTIKHYYNFIISELNKKKIKKDDISGIAISSVVPEIKKKLIKLSKTFFLLNPILINTKTNINFINLYKGKLGEDRISNIVAAEYLYKDTNKIIIDYGTAITFDIVNNKGQFLGGVIMPGFKLFLKALNQNTAQLPLLSPEFTSNFIGKTTKNCILSGLNAIRTGAIKYLIKGVKKYIKSNNVLIILTGGDSNLSLVKKLNEKKVILNKNLCLIGIKKIYDMNIK